MVQLDETIDNTKQKEAYQFCLDNNFEPNIVEISKERIRRAGKKIVEDNQDKEHIENLDIGFRVLKIDSTNMKDVYYTPDNYEQATLDNLESHIKDDRTGEDLLFQVMLDWGVPLSLPIEVKEIHLAFQEAVGHPVTLSAIYYLLKKHEWRKIMPRSRHPKKASPEAIEAYKKNN